MTLLRSVYPPSVKNTSSTGVASRLLVSASLVIVSGFAVSGCSLLFPASTPQRDEAGDISVADDNADVFEITVGDCLSIGYDSAGEVSTVPVVPCDQPHEDEVYYGYDLDHEEFPGEAAIEADFGEVCGAEFERFIGIPSADSQYSWWAFYPNEESWTKFGDREVLCVVSSVSTDETVTGTLAGIAQ